MQSFHVHPDIAQAETLETSFYTSRNFFEQAKEKIFARSIQFIGDTSLISENGSVYPFLFSDPYVPEPLILTNDKDGDIRCLSNVCTHRGNILAEKKCRTANLRCKYHGRMFNLSGKFISMPEFKEVKNFPRAEDDLHQLPVHRWGNLLFTSLDHSVDMNTILNEMQERLSWLPLHEFRYYNTNEYSVKAHWALYCENYLEGFHIPFVHAGLNEVIDFGTYTTDVYPYSVLQTGYAKNDEDCFDIPESSPDYGKKIAAYYYWIFPNMMFNFYPWGLSVNVIRPVSPGETRITFITYVWKEEIMMQGAGGDLHTVEMEDEDIVEKVQAGIQSRFYKHGRFSATREQGVHQFQRLIAEFMNATHQ